MFLVYLALKSKGARPPCANAEGAKHEARQARPKGRSKDYSWLSHKGWKRISVFTIKQLQARRVLFAGNGVLCRCA